MSRVPPPGTPLDHEEREFAALLARDRPSTGPSPTLDAAILATARKAARDETAVAPRRTRRPRMAWATGAGLAASLVLAVGVAWQIRPQGDAIEVPDEAPRAAASRDMGDAPSRPAPAAELQVAAPASSAPADTTQDAASRAEPRPAAARSMAASGTPSAPPDDATPVMEMPPAPPAPPPPAPVVFDAPEPTAAAVAPRREAGQQADAERLRRAEDEAADAAQRRAMRTPQDAARPAAAAAAKAAPAPPPPVEDDHAYDQPLDDAPPASADAPEVREAWLARIRELVAEERYAEARASFDEFRRRYPDVAVPRDLRVLLP
ncbi:hypothetical protein [Luteimonas sp. MC1572]|uniref:hypothetical protein n=1 Tax=Luteimonas sp. MC1572 TaxID=2799325 RepID=UPI0018F10722|nr:hypothetical protein [Luteimonas sp. MC1572]MBJ6981020.1 hypothetical protein [Luteimonas sp. MC1572]QQO02363.1 hypothetical protein JGR64_09120 [Luteimonas sp. MC1572]